MNGRELAHGLAALLSVSVAILPGAAPAYELLDGKWPDGIAPLWLNPNFPDTSLSGSPDEQVEIILCGANAWHDQSSARFAFDYRGVTATRRFSELDGINAVFWARADGADALAVTVFTPDEEGNVASFDIAFFSTTDGQENLWSGPGEPAAGTLDIQGVIAHELGHAAGLGHTGDIPEATMFPSIRGRGLPMRTLHADDRAGIEFVYGRRTEEDPSVAIGSIVPAKGPAAGTNEVSLDGANFTYDSDTRIAIGGADLQRSAWHVESCGRLRILAMPPGSPGPAAIRISNTVGTVLLPDAYVYEEVAFNRGDADGGGSVSLADAIVTLEYLFRGGDPVPCDDAADSNDDGSVDVADAVTVLLYLFDPSVDSLPPPFPAPGLDPTEDELSCGG